MEVLREKEAFGGKLWGKFGKTKNVWLNQRENLGLRIWGKFGNPKGRIQVF